MYKILDYPAEDEYGLNIKLINPRSLEKTAGLRDEIGNFLEKLEKDPKKYMYLLVNAMGAGENWGSNSNGDYFPEEALTGIQGSDEFIKNLFPQINIAVPRFKTFLQAKIFRHHQNRPDSPSYGDVLESFYNDNMKRVELILALNRDKAPDIVKKLELGKMLPLSMGARVASDRCCICNNVAKTRSEYCDCCNGVKSRLGDILPDGRKVYVINDKPRFFDISFVTIGADRTASVLLKVASKYHQIPSIGSAEQAEKLGFMDKESDHDKKSEMKKEIPVKLEREIPLSEVKKLHSVEPKLPEKVIHAVANHKSLPNALASLLMTGIVPRPAEFQKIIIIRMGQPDLAEQLDREGTVFEPVNHCDEDVKMIGDPDDDMSHHLRHLIEDRSLFTPHVDRRLILVKTAEMQGYQPNMYRGMGQAMQSKKERYPQTHNLIKFLAPIAGLYYILSRQAPEFMSKLVDPKNVEMINKNPKLSALALAGMAMAAGGVMGGFEGATKDRTVGIDYNQAQMMRPGYIDYRGNMLKVGSLTTKALIGVPLLTYMYGADVQNRANRGEPVGNLEAFVAENPGKTSLGLLGLGALARRALTK